MGADAMPKKDAMVQFHQKNILLAADRLFVKQGIQNTSMDMVAKEAHYSKATIYVYFRSKEEIFLRLVSHCAAEFNDAMKQLLLRHMPYKEKYMAMCLETARFSEEKPVYFEGFLQYGQTVPESKATSRILYDLLDEGIRSGMIRSAYRKEELALYFWASMTGIIQTAASRQAELAQKNLDRSAFLRFGFLRLLDSVKM